MTPGQWVSLALLAIGASWLVGVFIEIARDKPPKRTQEEIDVDVAIMRKKANNDRPRVRAGTEQINRRY